MPGVGLIRSRFHVGGPLECHDTCGGVHHRPGSRDAVLPTPRLAKMDRRRVLDSRNDRNHRLRENLVDFAQVDTFANEHK
jgi:hypothetical protein